MVCEVGASLIGTLANPVEDSTVAGVCILTKELQVACVGGKRSGEGWKGKSAKNKERRFHANGGEAEAARKRCYDLHLTFPNSTKLDAALDRHSPWVVRSSRGRLKAK